MVDGCFACSARSHTPLNAVGRQGSAAAVGGSAAAATAPVATAPLVREWVVRLPEGEFKQELLDCLGQGGTHSDVADLAYSPFPPPPPGVHQQHVLLPHHPDLPGVQMHQPGAPAQVLKHADLPRFTTFCTKLTAKGKWTPRDGYAFIW